MADRAGGRRSVVNPETKLWRLPVEVTQFWRPRSGFGARFCKTKKDYIDQESGEYFETKVDGNDSSYCWVHTNECICVLQKRKQTPKPLLGRQN